VRAGAALLAYGGNPSKPWAGLWFVSLQVRGEFVSTITNVGCMNITSCKAWCACMRAHSVTAWKALFCSTARLCAGIAIGPSAVGHTNWPTNLPRTPSHQCCLASFPTMFFARPTWRLLDSFPLTASLRCCTRSFSCTSTEALL
jgi:hypothetical protein